MQGIVTDIGLSCYYLPIKETDNNKTEESK